MKTKVALIDKNRCGQPVRKGGYKLPLKGKIIFLHVMGYRGTAAFERDIKLLGAVVEKCFSKEVDCLVTNKGTPADYEKKKLKGGASTSVPSPVTPSPFNMANVGVDSPQGLSPGSMDAQKPLTRGKAMAQAAKTTKCYGSTDVLESARTLKIKIIHIDSALKWIKKELEKLPAELRAPGQPGTGHNTRTKFRKLRGSYLKFEATNCHYRPVMEEFKAWPQIYFESVSWSCPFNKDINNKDSRVYERGEGEERDPQEPGQDMLESDTSKLQVKPKLRSLDKKKSSEDWIGRVMTVGDIKRMAKERKRAEMKRGYCELCQIKYDNIDQHVSNDQHRRFVRNQSNYASLDAVIDSGPNMQQFLARVLESERVKPDSPGEYEVLLLSEVSDVPLNKKSPSRSPYPGSLSSPKTITMSPRSRKTRTSSVNKEPVQISNALPRPVFLKEFMDEAGDDQLKLLRGNKGSGLRKNPIRHSPRLSKRPTQELEPSCDKNSRVSPVHSPRTSKSSNILKPENVVGSPLLETPRKTRSKRDGDGLSTQSLSFKKEKTPKYSKKLSRIKDTTSPPPQGSPVKETKQADPTSSQTSPSPPKRTKAQSDTTPKHQEEGGEVTRPQKTSLRKSPLKTPRTIRCDTMESPETAANIRRILKKAGSPRVVCTLLPEKDQSKFSQTNRRTRRHKAQEARSRVAVVNTTEIRVLRSRESSLTRDSPRNIILEKPSKLSQESLCSTEEGEGSGNSRLASVCTDQSQVDVGNVDPAESEESGPVRRLRSTRRSRSERRQCLSSGHSNSRLSEKQGPSSVSQSNSSPLKLELSAPNTPIETSKKMEPDSNNLSTTVCVKTETSSLLCSDIGRRPSLDSLPVKSVSSENIGSIRNNEEAQAVVTRNSPKKSLKSKTRRKGCVNSESAIGQQPLDVCNETPERSCTVSQKGSNLTPLKKDLKDSELGNPQETCTRKLLTPKKLQGEGTPQQDKTPVKDNEGDQSLTASIHGSRKVRLKQNWSLMSERSMRKLLDEEEGKQGFKGFTEDSITSQQLPSDATFSEVSEVEIPSESDVVWVLNSETSPGVDAGCAVYDGLDMSDENPTAPGIWGSPIKNVLDNVPNLMSDASSTDWDDNIDQFFDDQVERKKVDWHSPSACHAAQVLQRRQSPRRRIASPSKLGSSSIKVISSPVKRTLLSSLQSPKKHSQSPKKVTFSPGKQLVTKVILLPRKGSSSCVNVSEIHGSVRRSPRKGSSSCVNVSEIHGSVRRSPRKGSSSCVNVSEIHGSVRRSPRKGSSSCVNVSEIHGSVRRSPMKGSSSCVNVSEIHGSVRRSPRKESSSCVNVSEIHGSVRRSPRKHAQGQMQSPIYMNKSLDFSTPNFSLLDGLSEAEDLWVGPTRNEKSTPSYTEKAARRLASVTNASTPQRSPIYRQAIVKSTTSDPRKSLGPMVSTPCRKTAQGVQAVAASGDQVNLSKEEVPNTHEETDIKKIDCEVSFNFSSPQKTKVLDKIQEMTFPSPLTPLESDSKPPSKRSLAEDGNKHKTLPLSPEIDLTMPEVTEPPKKRLLKCGFSKKKTICVGYKSFDYDKAIKSKARSPSLSDNSSIASPTARPKTPSSGVQFSNLGAKLKPRNLEMSAVTKGKPPRDEIFNWPGASPVKQSPRKQSKSLGRPVYSPSTPVKSSAQRTKRRFHEVETCQGEQKDEQKKSSIKKSKRDVTPHKERDSSDSCNESAEDESERLRCGTTLTPSFHSPGRKLDKLLQLHSLENIQTAPRRKSAVVTSIVRFHHDDMSPPKYNKRISDPVQPLARTETPKKGFRHSPKSKSLTSNQLSKVKSPVLRRLLPKRLSSPSPSNASDISSPRKRLCMDNDFVSKAKIVKTGQSHLEGRPRHTKVVRKSNRKRLSKRTSREIRPRRSRFVDYQEKESDEDDFY